jgi:hypothetical protein
MARPRKGQIVADDRGDVTRYGIRFRDQYDRRRFESLGAVSEAEAEEALDKRLAEVRLGIYKPPEAAAVVEAPREEQTFHEFASGWLAAREAEGLKTKTLTDLHWSLEVHPAPLLRPLPAVGDHAAARRRLQGREGGGTTRARGASREVAGD